jgi:hypothetical protein
MNCSGERLRLPRRYRRQETDVAAAPVEIAGQGVEKTDRAIDLHRVGVLLDAVVGIVAVGFRGGEKPHGLAHQIGGNARARRGFLRRILP